MFGVWGMYGVRQLRCPIARISLDAPRPLHALPLCTDQCYYTNYTNNTMYTIYQIVVSDNMAAAHHVRDKRDTLLQYTRLDWV